MMSGLHRLTGQSLVAFLSACTTPSSHCALLPSPSDSARLFRVFPPKRRPVQLSLAVCCPLDDARLVLAMRRCFPFGAAVAWLARGQTRDATASGYGLVGLGGERRDDSSCSFPYPGHALKHRSSPVSRRMDDDPTWESFFLSPAVRPSSRAPPAEKGPLARPQQSQAPRE